MNRPEKIYYFAATHWDREWYRTVDEFRFRLVGVLDQVLRTLEDTPDFSVFTLDGQTSPLSDYLVIREEKREALARCIRSGKLVIGPWFTMPDEFLLSGESLIQNLLMGHRIASGWQADPLKVGYVCDTFGHIANLPQILNGFGIRSALISRGTNDCDTPCFFRWQSPDGSQVLTFKAPETCGYGSFFWEALCPFAPNYTEHLDEITARAIAYVERELTRTSLPYVILMDGMDHETIHGFMPEVLRRLSDHFGCPVEQRRLDGVFSEITGDMPTVSGELSAHCRENVMHNKLIPHTLSSRYDLKSANDACQNLLEHYAMPCGALDAMQGRDPVSAFLDHAYRQLLQNHAHDSICGCSIAAVHREMHTRFEKAWYTGNEYFLQFCKRTFEAREPGGELIVQVFNPLPYPYRGLVEMDIDFPRDFPVTELPYVKYEQRNAFHILDRDGNRLPYNLLHASRGNFIRTLSGGKQTADTHRVAILGELAPMGFTGFRIVPAEKPCRILDRFSTGPASCENEWIRFSVNPDGSVQIFDKETGQCYDRLHTFLDCGEIGDGWFHIRPIDDRVLSSSGCPVSIEKTFDGYAACKFLVRCRWALPAHACPELDFSSRSETYTEFDITSEFTVSRASKLVTVETRVHNSARDHRLQLHLLTGTKTDSYTVNQCNLMIQRPCGMDVSRWDWKEADISEAAFESMVLLRDETRGLLFLSGGGLHEVSCPADRENSMDITLLRCFRKTTGTNGEPDGQLNGEQLFRYALLPLAGESDCELVRQKDAYVSGCRAFTCPESRPMEPDSGFTLHSQNCAYVTALPSRQEGILIRVANYAPREDPCTLVFARTPRDACLCDFLENPTASAAVRGNEVAFSVPPYKMATVRIRF